MGEELKKLKKLEDYVKNHPELDFQDHIFVSEKQGGYYGSIHGIAVAPEARQVLLVSGDTRILLPFSGIHSVEIKGEVALKPDRKSQWIIAAVGLAIWALLGIILAVENADDFAFAILGGLILSVTAVGMLTVQQRVEETDTRAAGLRIWIDDFNNPIIDVVFVSNPDVASGYPGNNMSKSERIKAARKWYGRLRAIVAGQGDADWAFKHHPRVELPAD